METNVPKKILNELLLQVIKVEKDYAHEFVGVRNERRNEIKKIVNRVVSEMDKHNAD